MIQASTNFQICDNSGAKKAKCIKVLGSSKKKGGGIGKLVIVSVQKVKFLNIKYHKKKKVRLNQGEVLRALIIRTRVKCDRQNYSRYLCKENAIILLTNKNKPIGTRVLGPIAKEFRHSKFIKIASLSTGLI